MHKTSIPKTIVVQIAPEMKCKFCNKACIKKGFNKGIQRFQCKACLKFQQKEYVYSLCTEPHEKLIVKLSNEGTGISSIARIVELSKTSIIRKIKELAAKVLRPVLVEERQSYEVDEMHALVGNKELSRSLYIIYAINRRTKAVIDFVVGKRTTENIGKVIGSVLELNPKRIFTDKLNVYPGLIQAGIHTASIYQTNHIERHNLTLRTHQKRLTRKTICFSKSRAMLENCLRLYFWKKA
jgi:insertion element IS1 protein InsB